MGVPEPEAPEPDATPPAGDRWPSEPSRAARQDHAVLAWLVIEADLPHAVHLHLADAVLAWAPLMGEHQFPTEPEAGVDAGCWTGCGGGSMRRLWRPGWTDKVVPDEVRGRIGLTLPASLVAVAARNPRHTVDDFLWPPLLRRLKIFAGRVEVEGVHRHVRSVSEPLGHHGQVALPWDSLVSG